MLKYTENSMWGFIIIVSILLILYFHRERVNSGYRSWNVLRDFKNKSESAALLNRVNTRMINFMRYLRGKYHIGETDDVIQREGSNHNTSLDGRDLVQHMLRNYNPDNFYETDPRLTNDTSYTVNKGQSMYICLRQRDNLNKLVGEDILFFTMLHEASHIANYRGWAHGTDFWTIFKFILEEAVAGGYYTPVDYAKNPVDFCGLLINYNPLYDIGLPSKLKHGLY